MAKARYARELCELALETAEAFKIQPYRSVPAIDALKVWLVAQGCGAEFIENHADSILPASIARQFVSAATNAQNNVLVSFNIQCKENENAVSVRSWSRSIWEACINCVQANSEHDPRNFVSGEAAMTHQNECSNFVEFDSTLRYQLSHLDLKNSPVLLYAVQGASSARLDSVVSVCAECCGGNAVDAARMRHLVSDLRREQMHYDVNECSRQYSAVMSAIQFDPSVAERISCDRAVWPNDNDQLTAECASEAPCCSAPFYESTVRINRAIPLDHPADVAAKAFAQQVNFSSLHNMDSHRFLYVLGGMRNCSALFASEFGDEPEHTQTAFSQYVLRTRGEPLHDERIFPNLLATVFERPRTDAYMDSERSTLMHEVNSFVRRLLGGKELPSDEELPQERRVVMWITANSRGDAAARLSQWCGVAGSEQLTNLANYLQTTKGPSANAMHAMRALYFSGVGGVAFVGSSTASAPTC